jgi:hypothetical protein
MGGAPVVFFGEAMANGAPTDDATDFKKADSLRE